MGKKKDKVAVKALTMASAHLCRSQRWTAVASSGEKTMSRYFFLSIEVRSTFTAGPCFRSTFQNVICQGPLGQKRRCSTPPPPPLNGPRSGRHQIVFRCEREIVGQNLKPLHSTSRRLSLLTPHGFRHRDAFIEHSLFSRFITR